jgi:hypothetical protein
MIFWNKWNKEFKLLYQISLGLLLSSVLFFGFYYVRGIHGAISWETVTDSQKLLLPIESFTKGIFDFNIETDVFIQFQQFIGSNIELNLVSAYIFYGLLMLAIVLMLTVLTYLDNWIYFLGTGIIVVYFIFQQIDVLFTNFAYDYLLKIAPVFFIGGTSYLVYAFRPKDKFTTKIGLFSLVIIIYHLTISFFSPLHHEIFFMMNYGWIAALIISIGFIIFVSFEIVYGFLHVITNSTGTTNNKNGTWHFSIIFLLYMLNLFLQFLKNTRAVDIDILFISPFIIFITSTILGIWGFKERSVMYASKLPFYPLGAFLYIGWAVFAFTTVGLNYLNANDSAIEVFEDAILFTHLGFGLGFFLYVAWNYFEWINSNVKVSKIIYSYGWVSLLFVYLTGIIIVLSMFFYTGMFVFRQTMAGYYNGIADAYWVANNSNLAQKYYQHSVDYEFQNHKGNYCLGVIYLAKQDWFEAAKYFKNATRKQASAFAYANLAQIKLQNTNDLETITDLKDGLAEFPNSGELQNNLALLYEKIKFADSSLVYLQIAEKNMSNKEVALSNKIALLSKYKVKIDEKLPVEHLSSLPLLTNKLVYDQLFGFENNVPFQEKVLVDTILNENKWAYLNNYYNFHARSIDSIGFKRLEVLGNKPENLLFKTDINFISALSNYYAGNHALAMKMIDNLQMSDESKAGFYLNNLGLWALRDGTIRFSADIFQLANDKGNKTALINKAIALSEAGNWQEALQIWNSSSIKDDKELSPIAEKFTKILTLNDFNLVLTSDDAVKYAVLHYKINQIPDEQLGNLFFSFKDKVFQIKAGIDLFEFYFKKSNTERCTEVFDVLKNNIATLNEDQNKKWFEQKLNYLELKNLVLNKIEIKNLEKTNLNFEDDSYKYFIQAIQNEQKGNLSEAKLFYDLAVKKRPFDEDLVLKAASFYAKRMKNHQTSFNLLLDGIILNPYSVLLYKAYCMEAIHFGIPSFAENGLNQLKVLISAEEFKVFKIEFEKEKQVFKQQLELN